MIRTTVVGGALFLLPLIAIIILLDKAWQLSRHVARPIAESLPVAGFAGVALVELLGPILLLVLCYLAGLLATRSVVRRQVAKLDGALIEMLPPYAFVKTMVGSMAEAEGEAGMLTPVFVTFDDYAQMAFEVEREGPRVIVYLPGSPSPWSGSTVIVAADRVRRLNIGSHEMARMVRVLGRAATREQGVQ
jgi:uncharacterized membrane protein